MNEKRIPRGTTRCLRAAGSLLLIPEADLEIPVDVTSFKRSISYSSIEQRDDEPEPGMCTYKIGCAVKGCPVYLELITADEQVRPTAQLWYDTDGCKRV